MEREELAGGRKGDSEMEMSDYSGWLFRICEWVIRLAYVNLLWILFTLIGFIALGIFPATLAMFTLIRKWIMGEEDIPIFKTFWNNFRKEFWKANRLGVILFIIGSILYVNLVFFQTQNQVINIIFHSLILCFFLIYGIIALYIFPVFAHYESKFQHAFKNAFLIGIMNPIQTVLMALGFFLVICLLILVPGLIPFFSGSLVCLVLMWFSYRSFIKMDEKNG